MADVTTSVYKFIAPEVGSSDDTWGTKLNQDIAKLEALFVSAFDSGSATALGTLKAANLPTIFTKNHEVRNNSPQLRFSDTDATDPDGMFRFTVNSNVLALQKATAAGWTGAENIMTFNATAKEIVVPSPYNFKLAADSVIVGGQLVVYPSGIGIRMKETSSADGIAAMWYWNNTNLYLMLSDPADADGSYNSLRPFYVNKHTGAVGLGQGVDVSNGIRAQSGGLKFANIVASSRTDLSNHIDLYGGQYGFSVTSSSLNLLMPSSASIYFGGAGASSIEYSGILNTPKIQGIGRLDFLGGDSYIDFQQPDGTLSGRVGPLGNVGFSESLITLSSGDTRYRNASNLNAGTVAAARLPTDTAARDWVGARLSGMTINAIGSYALCMHDKAEDISPNETIAGANLYHSSASSNRTTLSKPPGTWRCMGYCTYSGAATADFRVSLFLRIS